MSSDAAVAADARLTDRYGLRGDEPELVQRVVRLVADASRWLDAQRTMLGQTGRLPQGALDPVIARTYNAVDRLLRDKIPLAGLGEQRVCAAVIEGSLPHEPLALVIVAGALGNVGPAAAKPGSLYLSGRASELMGLMREADTFYTTSLAADASFGLSAAALFRFASIMGDPELALDLGRRAGMLDETWADFLEGMAGRSQRSRNDPCWCGSGRKLKTCHGQDPTIHEAQRRKWLDRKLRDYASLPEHRVVLSQLLAQVNEGKPRGPADAEALQASLYDIALHEGGWEQAFLADFTGLLPEEEVALLAADVASTRSLLVVEAVLPDVVRVRDEDSGVVSDVSSDALRRAVRPGDVLCCRLLTVDGRTTVRGSAEVVPPERRTEVADSLASGDRDALVSALLR